jgi:hypothetical protein
MQMNNEYFDDLDLANGTFTARSLLVFTGCSGSGKSSAIDFLLQNNPGFRNKPYSAITGGPIDWQQYDLNGLEDIVIVDELLTSADLWPIAKLLRRKHTVIAASHLPSVYFKLLDWRWPTKYFVTDTNPEKISRYLSYLGLRFSTSAVQRYTRDFGANFTDVNIILERFPSHDFDKALTYYQRYCHHRLTPSLAKQELNPSA